MKALLKRCRKLFAFRLRETNAVGKILQALPFFDHCSPSELHRLELLMFRRTYGSGELVCARSSRGNALYIVQSGALESGGSKQETLGAGNFFGAEGLFTEARYKHDVTALEESVLLVLFRHDLEQFMQRSPDAAGRISSAFSRFFDGQGSESGEEGFNREGA